VTFFAAMDRTTVAVAVLTHYFAPVLVALFAPLFDKQRVPNALFAAVLATAGLALVLRPWDPTQRGGDVLVGGLLGTVSAFAYAGNVFVIQRVAARIGVARAMGWHSLAAAVLLLPIAGSGLLAVEPLDLLFLVSGAAVAGAFSGFIFVRGLRAIGSARAAVLAFLEPLVAVLVGWLVWGEALAPIAFLGGVLIIGAGLLVAGGSGILETWRARSAER
jgi:drug/metabolite transporter, DME family